MATFDEQDNVIDLFVNGPQGVVASYWQNSDQSLLYYIKDHLGSARVIMLGQYGTTTETQVSQYYIYFPFGQVAEAWGNSSTPYQFTGKEHDQHSSFDFHYFGARYYDARIGSFTTIDKAGQFASGYVYGANNPIMMIDRDGNFAFIPFLIGAAFSSISYALTTDDFDINELIATAFIGGIAGELAYAVSPTSSILGGAAGSLVNSAGGMIMTGDPMFVDLGVFTWSAHPQIGTNLKSGVGLVMGTLTTMEDLGKVFHGETEYDVQERQLKQKAEFEASNPGVEEWEAPIGQPDLTDQDLDWINKQVDRQADDPYHHVNVKKGAEFIEGHKGAQYRYGRGLHLDTQGSDKPVDWWWHLDVLGGGRATPFTTIQHVIFESFAQDYGGPFSRFPYAMYRASYSKRVY